MPIAGGTPFDWRRGPRSDFDLGPDRGVYALFLAPHASLPLIGRPANGLIYIGLAAGAGGLARRCHFRGQTRNHSPRKSLACLLMVDLALSPVLVSRGAAGWTWGLDAPSERRLTDWMHQNLELAIELCADPDVRESELVELLAPPLNLTKCQQTSQHRSLAQMRAQVERSLRG